MSEMKKRMSKSVKQIRLNDTPKLELIGPSEEITNKIHSSSQIIEEEFIIITSIVSVLIEWFKTTEDFIIVLLLTFACMILFYILKSRNTQNNSSITRICPKCGRPIIFESKFCQYCGKILP